VDVELAAILEKCYKSTGLFGKTFMPETFNTEFSALHKAMLAAIDGPHQKVVIAGPRGLGKTKTIQAKCMQQILFRDVNFLLYVTNAENVAVLQTENIKRELRTNSEIRRLFGDIGLSDADIEFSEVFSKKAWVAYGQTLVLPRGSGQQVRGLVHGRHRPDLIIVDDLERREEMSNVEIRKSIKEWFHADLEKCIDVYSNNWRIIYMDTLKHSDSLLTELLESPDWHAVHLDLCDDQYNSNVPAMFTTEELHKLVASHRANGTMDVFYMEYRNLPVSKEDLSFDPKNFKHYDESTLDASIKKRLENMIVVDPAKTAQMNSADSAVVGIGVDYVGGGIYIRDIVNGKMFPDQLYNEMFAMRRRLNAHVVGVEVTGLEEFIRQPIMNEMLRRGPMDSFEPVWLRARGGSTEERGKIMRIRSLVPYYRQGFVWHNSACCGGLEAQLTTFPRGKLVDIADATAYVIEMLEIGERYFVGPAEADDAPTEEYAELEYEPPLSNEWLRV
jgi:hypothetical protein